MGKNIDSKDIFKDKNTVVIIHDGQEYYLRITKSNKLILTK